jgi:glycosyltransferase involved in cell wall biosynthesis
MNVLHLGKYYYPIPGGIETQLRNLAKGLNELGVYQKVVVANTRRTTSFEIIDGIDIIRLASLSTLFSTPLTYQWHSYIKDKSFDVIHLHAPNPAAELFLRAFEFHGKLVVSYHSDIIRQKKLKLFYDPLFRWILEKADRLVIAGPSPMMYDSLIHDFRGKTVTIPYGIDVARWNRESVDTDRAGRIRSSYKRPIILFVGRLVYYKGLDYLIKAMTKIDATLLIVGTGPEKKRLAKLSEELGLTSRVFFIGFVPDEKLAPYYHACDIFCLPSTARSEAFGIVQLEAMACGKPVVSTEIGTATSTVNRDGTTGIVVSPGDSAALAGALNKILGNPVLRERFGKNAKEWVAAEFDYRLIAGRYHELYQSCL